MDLVGSCIYLLSVPFIVRIFALQKSEKQKGSGNTYQTNDFKESVAKS